MRFVKNVGLGFKTPKTAREGNYVDKKCPFTGDVSIRGRILKVCSCRALVVRWCFLWETLKTRGGSTQDNSEVKHSRFLSFSCLLLLPDAVGFSACRVALQSGCSSSNSRL